MQAIKSIEQIGEEVGKLRLAGKAINQEVICKKYDLSVSDWSIVLDFSY
jgi:hypothetical protein